eukprot:gene21029-27898_t
MQSVTNPCRTCKTSSSAALPKHAVALPRARPGRALVKANAMDRASGQERVADGAAYQPSLIELGVVAPVVPQSPFGPGAPSEPRKKRMGGAKKTVHLTTIKNEAAKERNRSARQMDTLMKMDTLVKELSGPLTRYIDGFPDVSKLHPFERTLLQLTVGENLYTSLLVKIKGLRKSIQEKGKGYASRAAKAVNKAAALELAEEGSEGIIKAYQGGARHIDAMKEVAKKLRALPSVELRDPTLALVGAPNVGKSSLVQVLSSGTPEIQNYPFTTRSIKIGHFFLDGKRHQVTDTPGLLARADEDRNKMELLTLAAMDCLPTSVLFVIDLTEECGTSVQDQWEIRHEVRERYPSKPWLDAFSKSDMLDDILAEGDLMLKELGAAPATAEDMAHAPVSLIIRGDNYAEFIPVSSPEDLVSRLPHAVRVSSLTEEGLPDLQQRIISLFTEAAVQEAIEAGKQLEQELGQDSTREAVAASFATEGELLRKAQKWSKDYVKTAQERQWQLALHLKGSYCSPHTSAPTTTLFTEAAMQEAIEAGKQLEQELGQDSTREEVAASFATEEELS